MGIPTQWSNYLFRLVALLLPLMFLSPTFRRIISRRPCTRRGTGRVRRAKPLLRQGLILLIAYIMFISPEGFYQLSRAYASIDAGDAVFYTYDDNGSLIKKIIAGKDETDPDTNFEEKVTYHYNLANRLETVTTNRGDTVEVVGYIYNDDGIRVESQFTRTVSGITDQTRITTYLVDVYNHTGYAQTLEEETVTTDYIDGVPQTPVTETSTYLIGDDIIAQSTDGNTQYLLYDGHGSTRQLAEYDGSVTIAKSYSYDGYGVLLQDDSVASANPGKVSQQATNLLYAGEHFDTDSQQYYLRARYYDPLNGRFNRIDPFSGNTHDPQSLHKYLYCHANPINATDPTGNLIDFSISGLLTNIFIRATTLWMMYGGTILSVLTKTALVCAGVYAASNVALTFIEWGYLPRDIQGFIESVRFYSGVGFVLSVVALGLLSTLPDPRQKPQPPQNTARLPRDKAVNGRPAPKPLPTSRPAAQNPAINAEKNRDVERLYKQGAIQVKVDQRQTAMRGDNFIQKGLNRPDNQGIFTNQPARHFEYDTRLDRLYQRAARIQANDPEAVITLKWFDDNGNYTIVPW